MTPDTPEHHSHEHPGHELGAAACQEAVAELYSYLDGALTEERLLVIQSHLQSCGDCDEAYDFEAELKMVIARRCSTEEVPESLRIRIMETLRISTTRRVDGGAGPTA